MPTDDNLPKDVAEGIAGKKREGKTGSVNKNAKGGLDAANAALDEQGGATTTTTTQRETTTTTTAAPKEATTTTTASAGDRGTGGKDGGDRGGSEGGRTQGKDRPHAK